jgi:hypothetical protein
MKLTHYGKDVLIKVLIAGLILFVSSIFIDNLIIKFILIGIVIFLWLFSLYFFRDPDCNIPAELKENQILSPADGRSLSLKKLSTKRIIYL